MEHTDRQVQPRYKGRVTLVRPTLISSLMAGLDAGWHDNASDSGRQPDGRKELEAGMGLRKCRQWGCMREALETQQVSAGSGNADVREMG